MTDTAIITPSFDEFPSHQALMTWMRSKEFDVVLGMMSTSARSKKPGRVLDRVKKKAKGRFSGLRIVDWSKAQKIVYGMTHTRSDISSTLLMELTNCPEAWAEGSAIFQTDLYLRTSGEHTEGNAVTSSCLSEEALHEASAANLSWKGALNAARIFASGLKDAGISPSMAYAFLIPFEGGACWAVNLPVEREEYGQKTTGQCICIRRILTDDELTEGMALGMTDLRLAMTKEGYPGKEAFAAMVQRAASPLA